MNRVFKAKISWWIFAPILVLVGSSIVLQGRASLLGGFFSLLALAFVLHMLFSTTYTVTPEQVVVQCSFLRWKIPTQSITRIVETHNPLSSPAPSLDRLRISYNKYDELMISPRDKQEFIAALRQLNPCIQVG
ncbi:protein of unknown function DUF1200 [Hymenobacter roseosalivarius DSM 11622]|uniref:Uncharacterized protein YyaB-like PH domain-containing protein n=1 Tax=Hymenobacter roseosalivarius DSM 11622 TaxID=645990 RepID=A0A1W1VYI9_9BACT|nr:PH domain-containing protein [Hymenobacter roseosalivarius]SMB98418.1 protein of unknown function DUF1200 [Hymenobacter roseosalivarius DSM 11622]